jgi:hypothetical protein
MGERETKKLSERRQDKLRGGWKLQKGLTSTPTGIALFSHVT